MLTKLGKILSDNIVGYGGNKKFGFLPIIDNNSITCNIETKDYGGNTRYISPSLYDVGYSYIKNAVSISGSASDGIVVGSGDTPASEDDYTLENKINGLDGTISSQASYFDATDKCYYSIYTLTLSNNTGESVTINEYGRIVSAEAASTKGGTRSNNRYAFLVERVVLDAPLVIPAGESSVLEYRINFPTVEDTE